MHRVRIVAGLVIAAAAINVQAPAPAMAQETTGKLKVCIYGLDAAQSATVTVDNEPFGAYPAAGKCQTDKIEGGGYTVRTEGGGRDGLDQAEILDRDGRRTDATAENIEVRVYPDETTRVNIFVR
ncbi:MAG: hypothetical protein ACT4PP_15190 [Sporichthyaceae bacterium]